MSVDGAPHLWGTDRCCRVCDLRRREEWALDAEGRPTRVMVWSRGGRDLATAALSVQPPAPTSDVALPTIGESAPVVAVEPPCEPPSHG